MIADDGAVIEKGRQPRLWVEVPDGVMLFNQDGTARDRFSNGVADAVTLPPGYTLQLCALSTPTLGATVVAHAFADVHPRTAALTDLAARLRTWWEDHLAGEYVPHHRFLLVFAGPARAPRGTSLARVVGEAQRQLRRLGVETRRLDAEAVRALLDAYPDPLADPEARERLDAVYVPGQGARSWARSFYIRVAPRTTDPGWLAPLLAFPAPLRLAIHVAGLDQDRERTRAKRRGRFLGDLVVGAGATGRQADVDTSTAQAEARAQALKMRTGGAAFVRAGIYVTVFAPDRAALDVRADALWGLLTSMGAMDAQAAYARGVQGPLLAATRPLGHNDAPPWTTYRVDAETIGNGWPVIARSPGMATGVPIGRSADDGALVRLNIRDRTLKNKLISTFGGSGQGKSFFVQLVMLWFMLWDAWATAIDTVGGYEALAAVAGGRTIRLGGPGTAAINLWDGPRATAEELATRVRFVVKAHEVLLAESRLGLDGLVRSAIGQGVRAVYAACPAGATPLERDLVTWLEGQATAQEDYEDKRLYKTLAAQLYPYVRDGEHAALVDRPTSFALDARLLAVQIDRKDLAPGTPIYAFVMFALTALVDRRHALAKAWYAERDLGAVLHFLGWDEGWALLKHQAGQEWVSSTGLTGRHDAVIADFINQKISHLAKGAAADFFDQASLHFILNMHDTNDESGVDPRKWVATKLHLTEGEAGRIDVLQGEEGTHSQLLMIRTSKYGQAARGVVNVPATIKEVYWLFASDPDDKDLRRRMVGVIAHDPERPTGDEMWAACCLLAAGKTPEDVRAAREREGAIRVAELISTGGTAWTVAR